MSNEQNRLIAARMQGIPWRKWGPYLSERQWGTVREDYSPHGDAWNYLSHDAARSRAYRWGEEGLAGISDDQQLLCFALGLWNEKDPVLKERLFGLTNSEGNHGEDVKEYHFYLDSTPTHSYMRYLYKYPQRAFPYNELINVNRQRSRQELEYELMDTGVFADNRYFDVFVEYAKAGPEDLLIEITVWNYAPEPARLHLLPTLWFRNTWSGDHGAKPNIELGGTTGDATVLAATHTILGARYLYGQLQGEALFTDNETNRFRFPDARNDSQYYKDAFDYYIVQRNKDAINPKREGTKAALHYNLDVPAQGNVTLRLRLSDASPKAMSRGALGADFSATMTERRNDADEFYGETLPASLPRDQRLVMRQALAGMLWSKQYYDYDVNRWLAERGQAPIPRNGEWRHLVSGDVISMPDKWEYPWYAAWDLAFHALPLGMVDADFAKQQLELLLEERYLHPNGQVPAYEWNFGDVNPPVHAWAAYVLFQNDRQRTGRGDLAFLRSIYQKLLLNFTWWVNRKDPSGRNVFEGGFLGLDNIGVFDRSAAIPGGGRLDQADGTAWMAFYSQVMLQMSLELAVEDSTYRSMALKFFEHFIWIASAMTHIGGHEQMWDEQDGFFYDVLRMPDGTSSRLKVRSMVGLLPLCAATVLNEQVLEHLPEIGNRANWFLSNRPELVDNIHDPRQPGYHGRRMLSILSEERLRRVLSVMLDENEFLSPYGIRSLSAYHREHPYVFWMGGQEYRVGYLPAESDSGMFGGNSNWRGPIWMPVNALLIRSLINSYAYYGDDFQVECPTGSGKKMNLYQVAHELTQRLARIFTLDPQGHRPVHGGTARFKDDPAWRDNVLFYEYFHGDNGAGIGANHQTGWTGLIAPLLAYFAQTTAEQVLAAGAAGRPVPPVPPAPAPTIEAPRRR
jgi:hypothetical protein